MEPEGSLPCSQQPPTDPYPEPDASSVSLRSKTFQVPNLMSIFGCPGRSKESVQVQGTAHARDRNVSSAVGMDYKRF